MILWRAMLPSFLRAVALVVVLVGGVVALAVSIEKANESGLELFRALRFQVLAAWVWLSPLMVALGVSLCCLRLRSDGEQQALACSGVGLSQLTPMVVATGLFVGLFGIAASEWILPLVAISDLPGWVWTAAGAVRTQDGLLVPLSLNGDFTDVGRVDMGQAFPRLASLGSLMEQGKPSAMTEQLARFARCLGCAGFAWLGLVFSRFKNSVIWVAVVCGSLTLFDSLAWSLGSQDQLSPWLAGTLFAWGWLIPGFIALRQPSTWNQ